MAAQSADSREDHENSIAGLLKCESESQSQQIIDLQREVKEQATRRREREQEAIRRRDESKTLEPDFGLHMPPKITSKIRYPEDVRIALGLDTEIEQEDIQQRETPQQEPLTLQNEHQPNSPIVGPSQLIRDIAREVEEKASRRQEFFNQEPVAQQGTHLKSSPLPDRVTYSPKIRYPETIRSRDVSDIGRGTVHSVHQRQELSNDGTITRQEEFRPQPSAPYLPSSTVDTPSTYDGLPSYDEAVALDSKRRRR